MSAYYNEHDPFAAAWLRELIADGQLPHGEVDERDIQEVRADDLEGFTEHHFFAGIGGWPLALRLAGWPEGRPVWTGSCPCQPLSGAGQRKGHADERHIWPAFHALIAECRPATVFGEQVASKDGREWLAGVRADLEALGYACGAADLCAASVGAPHIRQRLWWVADATSGRCQHEPSGRHGGVLEADVGAPVSGEQFGANRASLRGVADAPREQQHRAGSGGTRGRGKPTNGGGLGDADHARPQGHWDDGERAGERPAWAAGDFIPCADGKARRAQPGIFPLAPGLPRGVVPSSDPSAQEANNSSEARVGRLRGYGNAIIPQVAATFIGAYLG